ncbi:MAG: radical SAM protein [Candidatus Woesearchaeota archaeon]
MKILLVHRAIGGKKDSQQIIMPNGLYYLGALLNENGYNAELRNYSGYSDDDVVKDINSINPGIIGIACYTFNAKTVFDLCRLIKKINEKIQVFLGGTHATALDREIMEEVNDVDIIVRKEGEITVLELVNLITEGKDISEVKGITLRKNKKIFRNLDRELIQDLDSLPLPSKYYSYQRIITSRGCPGNCIFCSTPHFWGRKVRFRSPEKIVNELEMLNKKYGLSYFIFSDDTFTLDKERTIKICKHIIERELKITWDCRSRVNLVDEDRIKWLKKAGCISISYGVESGSTKILKNINKYISKEQTIKASELTKKYGLQLNFFIIIGSPGENDETINETIELIKETRPHDIIISNMQLTPDIELCNNQEIPIDKWFEDNSEPIYFTSELDIDKIKEYAEKVHREFLKNKGAYAFEELIQMIKNDPGSAQAFNNLGLYYLEKKMGKDACICFLKAIKLNPGYSQAYNNLGVLTVKFGDPGKAISLFEKALNQNPEDLMVLNNLGSLYSETGSKEDAKKCFEKALKIDPENKRALKNIVLMGN